MAMKYVRYKVAGVDRVIIFDKEFSHKSMMFALSVNARDVISAGTVDIPNARVIVSGQSTTLHRAADPDGDTNLICAKLMP